MPTLTPPAPVPAPVIEAVTLNPPAPPPPPSDWATMPRELSPNVEAATSKRVGCRIAVVDVDRDGVRGAAETARAADSDPDRCRADAGDIEAAGHVEAARAAAAADRLGENRVAVVAFGRGVALDRDRDRVGLAAGRRPIRRSRH